MSASQAPGLPLVAIRDDAIRLGQFLKLADLAESGAQARALIEDQSVTVDGAVETRRGHQLHRGAVVVVQLPRGAAGAVVG